MKAGLTLTQLAQEIERRSAAKKDFVAPTARIEMIANEEKGEVALALGGDQWFGVNGIAHDQIGTYTGIPAKYYDKMKANSPALLAANVNTWLHKANEPRMVRTLDGTARAFLSDRYSPDMENEQLAEAVLPVLGEMGLDVMSCQVTDTRLYIKAVDPRVTRELAKQGARFGDGGHTIVRIASPAITISNSEVGMGSLSVQGGYYDSFCSNLASFGERSMRKAHIGQRHTIAEGELYAMLSDKSRKLSNAALWSSVRDVVRGVFDRVQFDALINKVEGTQADVFTGAQAVEVVSLSAKRFGLNETEGKSVLAHLIEGGELSRFGLFNAVTKAAETVESYDRATALERLGGEIVELPRNEWKRLADQAGALALAA